MPQSGNASAKSKRAGERLRATDEDVVDGDVDELDDVANDAHDQETDADGLRDADELLLVGLCVVLAWRLACEAGDRTGAAVHEEGALLEELGGHAAHMLAAAVAGGVLRRRVLSKLLDVLHGDGCAVVLGRVIGVVSEGNASRQRVASAKDGARSEARCLAEMGASAESGLVQNPVDGPWKRRLPASSTHARPLPRPTDKHFPWSSAGPYRLRRCTDRSPHRAVASLRHRAH
jgi:hypothetical protein